MARKEIDFEGQALIPMQRASDVFSQLETLAYVIRDIARDRQEGHSSIIAMQKIEALADLMGSVAGDSGAYTEDCKEVLEHWFLQGGDHV